MLLVLALGVVFDRALAVRGTRIGLLVDLLGVVGLVVVGVITWVTRV